MRDQLLELLDLSDQDRLQDGEHAGNMVLLAETDGSCHWCCVSDAAPAYCKPRNGWSKEHVAIMDLLFGHLSQWCLDDVVDQQGRRVPPGLRMVLDPNFIWEQFKRGEKSLQTVLGEARPVLLEPDEWRDRWQVSTWRLKVATWWLETKPVLELGAAAGSVADQCRAIVELLESGRTRPPPYSCQAR